MFTRRLLLPPIVAASITCLFLILLVPVPSASSDETATTGVLLVPQSIQPSTFPISHIVYVMLENHAYDNYFGTYCTTTGPYCALTGNGIPSGACVPRNPTLPSSGCVKPYALPQSSVYFSTGGPHNWPASHTSYDNGSMDGFIQAANTKAVVGYYNGSTIPAYWNWAEQFALSDDFFSSALSFSLPNHWFAVGAQAPAISEDPGVNGSIFVGHGVPAPLNPGTELYLNESNATGAIIDEFRNSSVSWKFYDSWLVNATYQQAVNRTVHGNASQPGVFDFWDPLAAKATTYTPAVEPYFANRTDFFTDAAAGRLPSFSWIIPSFNESDHPPANISLGESFVSQIFNAVENSSEWSSTAVFVTWDEYGGYYDHLAPPQVDANGYSFRVPLLVVSPYTPVGYISHSFGHFESVLKLAEWKFGLANLSTRDGLATVPLDFFDLNATARGVDHVSAALRYPTPLPPQHLLRPAGLTVKTTRTTASLTWSEATGGAPVAGTTVRWGTSASSLSATTVPRTQSALTFAGLNCNTSYTFSVTSFAGNSHSPSASVHAKTSACGSAFPSTGGRSSTWLVAQSTARVRLPGFAFGRSSVTPAS